MYYTLLTTLGARLLANAQATATPIKLTHMAVGEGDGQPDQAQTELKNQRYKAQINHLSIDQNSRNQIIAELVIPEDVGGWYIREVGLFAEDGTLFAVGNLPESFKPLIASGSARTQTVRMVIAVSNAEHITLKIDPSVVLATRQWVIEQTQSALTPASTIKSGIVQLSTATDSDNKTTAATSKAIKIVNDNANNRVAKSGDVMTGALRINGINAGKFSAGLEIRNNSSSANTGRYIDFYNAKVAVGSIHCIDNGSGGTTIHLLTTPDGDSTTDRRQGGLSINPQGQVWTRAYGNLHDYFAKTTDLATVRENANNRVAKSGDVMDGVLKIEGQNAGGLSAGLEIHNRASTNNTGRCVDFYNAKVAVGSIHCIDNGSGGTTIHLLTTPDGDSTTDRRRGGLSINPQGQVWTRAYGNLHDYFAKITDKDAIWQELNNIYRKNRFSNTRYSNHYQGAEVYKIPTQANGGLKIITMFANINGTEELWLPESIDGFGVAVATDVGEARRALGTSLIANNKIKVYNSNNTTICVHVIGWGNF